MLRMGLSVACEEREERQQGENHQHESWMQVVAVERYGEQECEHAAQHARAYPQQHVCIVELSHEVHRQGAQGETSLSGPSAVDDGVGHKLPYAIFAACEDSVRAAVGQHVPKEHRNGSDDGQCHLTACHVFLKAEFH